MTTNLTKAFTGSGHYEQLLVGCKSLGPIRTAVAYPCEATALAGAIEAANRGLIAPLLVGPACEIAAACAKAGRVLGDLEIIDIPNSTAAASRAVELVREGKAEILMKGSLHTDEFMAAVVSRETGLSF